VFVCVCVCVYQVWAVAVYGGNLLLLSSIALAIFLGSSFQVDPQHSLFVAVCLSFSSNPLASRIVDRESSGWSGVAKKGRGGEGRCEGWVGNAVMVVTLVMADKGYYESWLVKESRRGW